MATKSKHTFYRRILTGIGFVIAAEIVLLLAMLTQGRTVAILQPAGTIASQQKDLIIFASILSLFVVVPVFVLLGFILWRYRDGNVKAKYRPNWDGSKKLESIWWGLPTAIIIVLAIVTYQTSHSLDPYKALASEKQPLTVQVVALQWKWLFIYPEYNTASVNQLHIPVDRPVNFEISADAPMNSFWIPQLGGMVYAMTGMTTKLHLEADKIGVYDGMSSNISGEGFSGMKFKVYAQSDADFIRWQETSKAQNTALNETQYQILRQPTENEPESAYSTVEADLFSKIIARYASPHAPTKTHGGTH